MELHFNSFSRHKKLAKPIYCCLCGKEINNMMDAHDPEPIADSSHVVCNKCNEHAVNLRLTRIRESGL